MSDHDPRRILRIDSLVVDVAARTVSRFGRERRLRPRQLALLLLLMKHARQTVSREAIAEALWNDDTATWTNVIAVTVSSLRRMIEIPDRPTLLHTVRGEGYRIGEDPDETEEQQD